MVFCSVNAKFDRKIKSNFKAEPPRKKLLCVLLKVSTKLLAQVKSDKSQELELIALRFGFGFW